VGQLVRDLRAEAFHAGGHLLHLGPLPRTRRQVVLLTAQDV
jgi:hypothetical protein